MEVDQVTAGLVLLELFGLDAGDRRGPVQTRLISKAEFLQKLSAERAMYQLMLRQKRC